VVLKNVYLPCTTTPCRNEEFIDCLANILNDISNLQYTHIIFGGDMNFDFTNDTDNDLRLVINDFACELDLQFVDDMLPLNDRTTYRVTTTGAK